MEETSTNTTDDIDFELINPVEEPQQLRDTYCFETDHIALKGNADYQSLLKTICVLEAQRIQAVKDIDILHRQQKEALNDPIGFVDKLQRGEDLQFPKPLTIAALPVINWEEYTNSVDFNSLGNHRHMTRIKRQLQDGNTDDSASGLKAKLLNDELDIVRGRHKDSNKSSTFNLLWTVEEQKRLEDLLIKFPPEEVEAKRWQKVATALGNRTPQQVASRIQKYFIKLTKAGLPVPGRTPTLNSQQKKMSGRHKFSTINQHSTFLQSHEPPVYMSDDDDSNSYCGSFTAFDSNNQDQEDSDDDIPLELRHTPEYRELVRLKAVRKQKLMSESKHIKHIGYKCDNCGCDPIVGTRWHCADCPQDDSVDFCEDCVDSNYEMNNHNSSHRLKPIKKVEDVKPALDEDYMRFMPGDYNYLDPNYMPAS